MIWKNLILQWYDFLYYRQSLAEDTAISMDNQFKRNKNINVSFSLDSCFLYVCAYVWQEGQVEPYKKNSASECWNITCWDSVCPFFLVLHHPLWQIWVTLRGTAAVAAHFVTTARFVTKVTKHAAMPAYFVTNKVVTNRAGIAPFFTWLSVHVILYVSRVCVCMCECACAHMHACMHQRERNRERNRQNECVRQNERE